MIPSEAIEYNRLHAESITVDGYPDLLLDPKGGSQDERALFAFSVVAFQAAAGLPADGKLGPKTLAHMRFLQPSQGLPRYTWGMYCDFRPLEWDADDQLLPWLQKHKPAVAWLGLNEDGQSDLRLVWKGPSRVKQDIEQLRRISVKPGLLVWYDFRKSQNENLKWVLDLIVDTGVEKVALDCEYWANRTAKQGHRCVDFAESLLALGCELTIPAFAQPVDATVSALEQLAGPLIYEPMIYSNFKGQKHSNPWRPGDAQRHFFPKAPAESGPWINAHCGLGNYDLSDWGMGSRVAFTAMVDACVELKVPHIDVWSAKHIDQRDWIGEVLNQKRWGV